MEILSHEMAKRTIDYTPSNFIDAQIKKLPERISTQFPSLTQDGVTARNSAGRAAFDGFNTVVQYSRQLGTGAALLPAASRSYLALPYASRVLAPQPVGLAMAAEWIAPYADKGISNLLERANTRNSVAERVFAVGLKVGALFLFELPRLAITSLRLGAVLTLGAGAAAVGLGYYALMASAGALRGNRPAPNTAGEAVDTVAAAAADSAQEAASTVESAADKGVKKAEDAAETGKDLAADAANKADEEVKAASNA